MTTITGTSAEDTLTGTAGADVIYGLDADDTLTGGDDNDILYGDANPGDANLRYWYGLTDVSDGDILLNTTVTDSNQQDADVAGLTNGTFVTVWAGKGTGDTQGIFASIAANDGTIVEAEIAITSDGSTQRDPQVTTLSNGNFVVTWERDGANLDVYQRLYDEDGTALTSATLVNTTTSGHQYNASVAARADGEYVVVWQNEDDGFFQQLYNDDGTTSGSQTELTDVSGKPVDYAMVRNFADGTYVVAWQEQDASTAGQDKILFQFFNDDGTENGDPHRVTSNTISGSYTEFAPTIAPLSDGNVLILWSSGGSPNGYFGQVFDSNGDTVSSQQQFEQTAAANVVVLPDDTFIIMWDADTVTNQFAQRYNQDWEKIGFEFQVNHFEDGYQSGTAGRSSGTSGEAALLDNGDVAFVWTDLSARDGSSGGIYGNVVGFPDGVAYLTSNDSLSGGDGDDTLFGGVGNDILTGGDGNDSLLGGAGNDTLTGGNGNDSYAGNAGNDYLVMDADDVTTNSFNAGTGTDTVEITGATGVSFDLDTHAVEVAYGSDGGNDSLSSSGSIVTGVMIFGRDGNDTLTGADYNDTLYGGTGNDSVTGGDAHDEMYGGTGDDSLAGGGGNDSLTGGTGNDVLAGGGGVDTYFYNDAAESGTGSGNRDIIQDFSQADEDIIDISKMTPSVEIMFLGTSAFTGNDPEVRYVQTGGNTIIQVDTDADTFTDAEIELTGLITLTAADFFLG